MNKIEDFDIVLVKPSGMLDLTCNLIEEGENLSCVIGREGVVISYLPIDDSDDNDPMGRAIYLGVRFDFLDDMLLLNKKDLIKTGKKAKYEDYYDGSSVGVSQEGKITDVNIKDDE